MKIRIEILRRRSAESKSYMQTIIYETDDVRATVATALNALNADDTATDIEGKKIDPIAWQCSCMQKKCGACAMVINGVPALACDCKLADAKDGVVRLSPLRKFPVVVDLIVDRSVMYENLMQLKAWLTEDVDMASANLPIAYEAARCLQCGCCLEVCPNFESGGDFTGMASMPPVARLLTELPASEQRELRKRYNKRFFEGCGKSLACRNICPAGIDIDRLLVNSNAVALWRRLGRQGK